MAQGALDRIRQSEKLKEKTAGLRKGLGEILLEDYRLSSRKGEEGKAVTLNLSSTVRL